MKCDTCIFQSLHLGAGPPDDYSMEYCSKGHWEGGILGEVIEEDLWVDCQDYKEKENEK